MERYNSFNSANQLYGSTNAPIGILLCKAANGMDNAFAIMNLPNSVMIFQTNKENADREVIRINPDAKVY
ncbi:MAG: hypothetical protein RL596_409 [Bacteroidota bacterium]|jgi:hypothetical protein